MAEQPDYYVCATCGGRNRFGSSSGCPHCGSQDSIILKSQYDRRRRMQRAGDLGFPCDIGSCRNNAAPGSALCFDHQSTTKGEK